jgi:putative resolvase
VLDGSETTDGLVWDVSVVLTSLCVRLLGRGSVSRRAADAVAVATKEDGL